MLKTSSFTARQPSQSNLFYERERPLRLQMIRPAGSSLQSEDGSGRERLASESRSWFDQNGMGRQHTRREQEASSTRSNDESLERTLAEEDPLSVACPTIDQMPAMPAADSTVIEPVNFDVLYREQRTRVLATVRSVIGPSDEIEDVVQLVFIEVHRSLARFQGRSKLSTWIYRIAVNVALQHIRRKKRRRWLMLGQTGDETDRQANAWNSELRIEDRQLLEHVYRAADRLSEKKRTVWILHELQGLTPDAIGEILEIPMNTVRSRLLAARKEIRYRLERAGVLPEGSGR